MTVDVLALTARGFEDDDEDTRAGNGGAKMCVGTGVERYMSWPESGRNLFRGVSA